MRVRGEAPGGEAARLMSRRAGNARARFCDPIPNPGRAERLRSAWKGAGDRDAGWRMDLPGETRRTAAPLWRCAEEPACTRRSARVVSDLQDVKKVPGVRGYGGTGVRGYGGTGVRYDVPAVSLSTGHRVDCRHGTSSASVRSPNSSPLHVRPTMSNAGSGRRLRGHTATPGSGILQARCTTRTTSGSSPSRA